MSLFLTILVNFTNTVFFCVTKSNVTYFSAANIAVEIKSTYGLASQAEIKQREEQDTYVA